MQLSYRARNHTSLSSLSKDSRFDSIIVWGHGVQYIEEILKMVRDTDEFIIVRVIKFRPSSMKRFVKKVYAYDYAPLGHLKDKIKYLRSIDSTTICIVINNTAPNIDIFGVGSFRHKECLKLKRLKTKIREKFNPYRHGEMTHDHVVHATDNEEQTYHILNAIGDISLHELHQRNFFDIPFFLGEQRTYEIIDVRMSDLLCGQATGGSDKFKVVIKPIFDSVQFLALVKDGKDYRGYINKYLGTALKSDYHVDGFLALAENFEYLAKGYEKYYVVVKRYLSDKYLVVDGLHRASLHLFQGNEKIKVCLIP